MTDAERAAALADKFQSALQNTGKVELTDDEDEFILKALRLLAATPATATDLREVVAERLDLMPYGDGWQLSDAALSAISATGYVIVPREPTEEMIDAAEEEMQVVRQHCCTVYACDVYETMIRAAIAVQGTAR